MERTIVIKDAQETSYVIGKVYTNHSMTNDELLECAGLTLKDEGIWTNGDGEWTSNDVIVEYED